MTVEPDSGRSLKQVRAALLRARLLRRGVQQLIFATIFLMGALTFAVGPEKAERTSRLWMAALAVISTLHVAIGLRIFTRVKRWPGRAWPVLVALWGGLLTAIMRYLLQA